MDPPSFIPSYLADQSTFAKSFHSTCGTLATVFLFTRLWVRTRLSHGGLWWDDYVLIVAWALLLATNGTGASSPGAGFRWTSEGTALGFLLHTCAAMFVVLSVTLSKSAFAVTLLRLTSATGSAFDTALLWFLIVAMNMLSLANSIAHWVNLCGLDVPYPTLPGSMCIPTQTLAIIFFTNTTMCLLSDIVLAVYPWKIVRKLRISKEEKWTVSFTMGLVGITGIVAIAKIVWTARIPRFDMFESSGDYTWNVVILVTLNQLEAAVMIIAQTIPIIRIWVTGSCTSSRVSLEPQGQPDVKTGDTKAAGTPGRPGGGISTLDRTARGSLELVELPGGRIVEAQEARRLEAESEIRSPVQQESRTTPPSVQPNPADEFDEVHEMWAAMGLSRKAWSPPRVG